MQESSSKRISKTYTESNPLADSLAINYMLRSLYDRVAAIYGHVKAEDFIHHVMARFQEQHLNGTLESVDMHFMDDILELLEQE